MLNSRAFDIKWLKKDNIKVLLVGKRETGKTTLIKTFVGYIGAGKWVDSFTDEKVYDVELSSPVVVLDGTCGYRNDQQYMISRLLKRERVNLFVSVEKLSMIDSNLQSQFDYVFICGKWKEEELSKLDTAFSLCHHYFGALWAFREWYAKVMTSPFNCVVIGKYGIYHYDESCLEKEKQYVPMAYTPRPRVYDSALSK